VDAEVRATAGRALFAGSFLLAGILLSRWEPTEVVAPPPPLPLPEAASAEVPRAHYFLEVALRALWSDLNHEGSLERARGKPEEILALLEDEEFGPPAGGDDVREAWKAWMTRMRDSAHALAVVLEGDDVEAAKEVWQSGLVEAWKARVAVFPEPSS